MGALDDLRALGAPIDDAPSTARFINQLQLSGQQKARLLREYLRAAHQDLSRAVLIEARDYSFFL
jgi:hypothetical protein